MSEYSFGCNRIENNLNRFGEHTSRIVTTWPSGRRSYPENKPGAPTRRDHYAVYEIQASKTRSHYVDCAIYVWDAAALDEPAEVFNWEYRKKERAAEKQAEHDVAQILYGRGFVKILDWEDVAEWKK